MREARSAPLPRRSAQPIGRGGGAGFRGLPSGWCLWRSSAAAHGDSRFHRFTLCCRCRTSGAILVQCTWAPCYITVASLIPCEGMEAALKLGVETMRHRSILGPDKTGTISRKQARSAALAAKTARPATSRESATSAGKAERLPQTLPVWERFLGQFGATGSHQVMRSSPVSTRPRETDGTGR